MDIVLFSYSGNGRFEAVVFYDCCIEKTYSQVAYRTGPMCGITPWQFKIEIKESHLGDYCYGIVSRSFFVIYSCFVLHCYIVFFFFLIDNLIMCRTF